MTMTTIKTATEPDEARMTDVMVLAFAGLGSALLKHRLIACDRDNNPAYLESPTRGTFLSITAWF